MSYRLFARFGFFIALVTISYLALAPLTHTPISTGWDKLNHVLAFGVLLLLFDLAYPQTSLWKVKVLALVFYACLIELLQIFIPLREFSLLDIVADLLGMGSYLLLRTYFFSPAVES